MHNVLSRGTLIPASSVVASARRRASVSVPSTSGRHLDEKRPSHHRKVTSRVRFARKRSARGLRATQEDTATKSERVTETSEGSTSSTYSKDTKTTDGETSRLWSNIAPSDDGSEMVAEPGSFPGAIALVAGTTVGAGMLALPAVCQSSGFVPSTVALVGCWGYMLATGLLILEVNLDVMQRTGAKGASIVTMADKTLGKNGVRFAWCAYVFIHYALLVAYISRVGELIGAAVNLEDVPNGVYGTLYAGILGTVVYTASPQKLDKFNSALVLAVIGLFAPLLLLAGSTANFDNFTTGDWTAVPSTIPVIALAFVFHNVVPVVATQLEGDVRKSKLAIGVGTSIPFVMFVLWDAALLGSVSQKDAEEALDAVARSGGAIPAIADPLTALQATSPTAAALVSLFSFFAITTSFLGFVLGLVDFLSDGLGFNEARKSATEQSKATGDTGNNSSRQKSKRTQNSNDPRSFTLALVPPWLFALSYPDIFLDALDSAGTFGVLTLFGCMPPAMAWVNRGYGGVGTVTEGVKSTQVDDEKSQDAEHGSIVPGGKPVLVLLFAFAGSVVLGESVQRIGALVFDR